MLRQAFNDDALGKSQVYEWFSRFKSGNMSTEDMPRPGRPSTGRNDENIAKIKRAIDEDRRKTIDQLSEETNISWSTVQTIQNFFLFPRMKRSLKGKRFRDVDEVKENALKALNSIQPQEFQHCFEQWQKRWDKCINAHGQYFEGD
ncbi:hypothetical protein B7P43_G04434 [Cryptotermes secundus]|uniref:Mos1 transposase HTH domain-containing protein n=1 Tax=Cryptotermes secundus TaxID=105785 RepID=A0A2J7QJT9_9NEOP|nr:hypothetical protein B7P43_G04434 [Cryptotermes secundus]